MHKDGKWARQIIELQEEDGKWGCFHSLSQSYGAPMTTEQALRRLERLGYTIKDECIGRAVDYMNDCLCGRNAIPDRAEKCHDWEVFTAMILSAWIRRFTDDVSAANRVAQQWAEIIAAAFANGAYDHEAYIRAYRDILKPCGGRIIDFANFYPISLICGCLDEFTENALMEHILNRDKGIYYIYDERLSVPPKDFASRNASRYLAALELLAGFGCAGRRLGFAAEWLCSNRNENGRWDMGRSVNDKVYFPLSDDWRKPETREADCTERIEALLGRINGDKIDREN